MKGNLWTVSKNNQISNFLKIFPVGAELFRPDGHTDVTKLIVAFGNFVNAPKKSTFCLRTVFMFFVWIQGKKAIISLYLTGWCNREGICLLQDPN
jgi:hypothetical protein